MNWYKQAQQLEVEENPKGGYYTMYGYDVHSGGEYNPDKPNYMWAYINGEIVVAEETPMVPGHSQANEFDEGGYVYAGRYDSKHKIITASCPHKGLKQFTGIPSTLKSLLRQAFPEAQKLIVY